ncbi:MULTISPECIES: hypothetical protein [unclassified Streptomyces]|uniref:hypothetical protein n=1 Tax=unclassified Streptomyces TaxID=2593676 RepID=UPI0033F26F39
MAGVHPSHVLVIGDHVEIVQNPKGAEVGTCGVLIDIVYDEILQPYVVQTTDGRVIDAAAVHVVEGPHELASTGGSPTRAVAVAAGVLVVSALTVPALHHSSATESAAPAPWTSTMGPVRPYKPEPRVTTGTTRAGERTTLPTPTERIATPSTTPAVKHPIPVPPADIRVSFYRDCTGHAQQCIDAGDLTMYAGRILAGHNYMGYQWLSRVPVGRTVRVISGPLAGTYRVYSHMKLNRQGGSIPDFGPAALVLQTCEGSGTGFSLLRRI